MSPVFELANTVHALDHEATVTVFLFTIKRKGKFTPLRGHIRPECRLNSGNKNR
jgi:hypothetical protein